ncbi:MAG TPA: hypothetical protein VJL81_16010 [Solirubrobacterales bacterium]|nr:hypothetical protein [Solirubrobacterales bacterium]
MSIILTPAQAAALAKVAGENPSSLQLHQIGEDPDLFVTFAGQKEPALRIRDDGVTVSL